MKTKEQMRAEYGHLIPEGVLDYLIDYAHGDCYPGGHFVTAVLTNDLLGAFSRADVYSTRAMPEIMRFVYNDLPAGSYGSVSAMNSWIQASLERRARA